MEAVDRGAEEDVVGGLGNGEVVNVGDKDAEQGEAAKNVDGGDAPGADDGKEGGCGNGEFFVERLIGEIEHGSIMAEWSHERLVDTKWMAGSPEVTHAWTSADLAVDETASTVRARRMRPLCPQRIKASARDEQMT